MYIEALPATIVAGEKQGVLHNLSVCICSLRYPECNTHAILQSVACIALQYFSRLSHKRYYFRKELLNIRKMRISSFSTNFAGNIFHSKKNRVRYDKNCLLFFM